MAQKLERIIIKLAFVDLNLEVRHFEGLWNLCNMTKVVFKGGTDWVCCLCKRLQTCQYNRRGCVPVNVERMQKHWSVQRVDQYIERVEHV